MAGKRVASTPVDIAASLGAMALMAWLDVVQTVRRPELTAEETLRAEQLGDVVEQQVTEIRRLKAGE